MAETETPAPTAARHMSVGGYVGIWVALVVFTGLTFFFGHLHLGHWNLVIALAIASAKMLLVVLFFMHLLDHRGTSRIVMAVTLVFVVIMLLFTLSDVAFRFPLTNPPGSDSAAAYLKQGIGSPRGATQPTSTPEPGSQPRYGD